MLESYTYVDGHVLHIHKTFTEKLYEIRIWKGLLFIIFIYVLTKKKIAPI